MDRKTLRCVAPGPVVLLHHECCMLTACLSQTRSFAAVLFRRISTRTAKDSHGQTKELFLTLQKPQRDAIRTKLLECLATETVATVRHKVGDAIAEIARQYVDGDVLAPDGTKESWTELLGALFHASQSSEAGQREAAFRIFATTPGIIEKQHEDVVMGAFTKGFGDSIVQVRISCCYRRCYWKRPTNDRIRYNWPPWTPLLPSSTPSTKSRNKSTTHSSHKSSTSYLLSKMRTNPMISRKLSSP